MAVIASLSSGRMSLSGIPRALWRNSPTPYHSLLSLVFSIGHILTDLLANRYAGDKD